MSALKFQSPSYKLYEPDYHPQKTIIVGLDDRLESPETLTLRYEEAQAGHGDPNGDSSPRLYEMAAYSKAAPLPSMNGYDPIRYTQSPYDQYPGPSYPSQPNEKYAQMNQQAFAANNAVGNSVTPYMQAPPGPTVLSCNPPTGTFGTKVFLRISSHYDIFSISTSPYLCLQFGSQKCPLEGISRENTQDGTGYIYSCSADAPQLGVTGCDSSSVPLSLVIQGAAGEEISRTVAGSFQYLEEPGDGITRTDELPKHDNAPPATQVGDHGESVSPKTEQPPMVPDAGTNNYEDPSQQGHYSNGPFPQNTTDMISTYRSSSFVEAPYHRRSAHGWTNFPGTLGSTGRSPILNHGMGGRQSVTPLSMPGNGTPQLVRTSTITNTGSVTPYSQMPSLYSPNKAILKINGKLNTMASDWTPEEWGNSRRIVLFRRSQHGSTLQANFRPVPVNERPPNSICVSCIYWARKGECFVTSVDTISLLEQLVMGHGTKFTVEEKNRIRRNLEGFHPLTVSKAKADSEEFFKLIMGFPNPKPRNIEKDVKVFPWTSLEPALKKIIGKYSANPGGSAPPPPPSMIAPPPYATLPTPPGQSLSQPSDHHSQYSVPPNHHDAIPSPRSLSGSGPSWTPYTAAPSYQPAPTRALSPNMRHPSPQHPPPMRINTNPLPAVTTYDTRSVSTGGYAPTGLHTPISHVPSTATPPRWDPTPASYDNYPSSMSSHHHHHHHAHSAQHVYNTAAAYADGAPRA